MEPNEKVIIRFIQRFLICNNIVRTILLQIKRRLVLLSKRKTHFDLHRLGKPIKIYIVTIKLDLL